MLFRSDAAAKPTEQEQTKDYPATPKRRRSCRKALVRMLKRVNAPILRASPFWQRVIAGIALGNALLAVPIFFYGLFAML